ncbi:IS1167%2C transposase [Streptococcus pneumoniae]|nr:IS1167%2C transposase [Streptococcus pneumoniae]CWI62694.1 IS1167%2C transposase [Streptococcus pneumoniae]
MTDIAHQLSISTSTVIRKLNDFHFKHDFSCLPEIMSWDEYAFTKGKMSFIAQDFNNLNIITVLKGRTQAVIRNPMNTRLSSATGNSFNRIAVN